MTLLSSHDEIVHEHDRKNCEKYVSDRKGDFFIHWHSRHLCKRDRNRDDRMALTSQREGKTPPRANLCKPSTVRPSVDRQDLYMPYSVVELFKREPLTTGGCLPTAQKTRTVAEGHTRLWLRFRRVVGAVRRRSAPINPSFIHKTCGHSTGLRRER